MPRVAIFADASLSSDGSAAAYGVWIKTDGKPSYAFGAPFKNLPPKANTDYYEAAALANASFVARQIIPDGRSAVFMLQSDNIVALSLIHGALPYSQCNLHPENGKPLHRAHPKTHERREMFDPVFCTLRRCLSEVAAELRWVPGHRGGGGRAWVNRLCDDLARKARERNRRVRAEESALWVKPRR